MNKSALKRFATQARLDLMAMVNTKLGYLLSLDESSLPIEYRDHASNIQKIKERCSKNGKIDNEIKDDFVEEVAYTWFNRLIALRFMDANEITDFAVISTTEEQILPPIYTKAKEGTIDKDLRLDRDKFFRLIDGKIFASNPDNEAYKMLFIAVCNYYSSIMPFMFESISDYTELLLPDDMLSLNSIRAVVVNAIPVEDCQDIEIIGWLYQYYIAEKKDQAMAKKGKYKSSEIPAVTQLFTPDWIVKYMVENTLGKLWILNNPSSPLKSQMKYYIENPEESSGFIKISSPEEITLLDSCMGSGHILTYAFDLLTKIYEEAGYSNSDIPSLILEKNLYGCDIDKRAATLAKFALTMKARIYYRRFFRKLVKLNAIELEDFGSEEFKGIKIFGSLLSFKAESEQFNEGIFGENTDEYNLQKSILSGQYHCVITNPPYMGNTRMTKELSEYVKTYYEHSKEDLFACFLERCLTFTSDKGYHSAINQHSWMFLSSFEELRKVIIEKNHIASLLHLGLGVFKELNSKVVQSTAFTIQKISSSSKGIYIDLTTLNGLEEKEKDLFNRSNWYHADQKNYLMIPFTPIAYWVKKENISVFKNKKIIDYGTLFQGMITGNNEKFVRFWSEINVNDISFNCKNVEDFDNSNNIWVPYNKGGESVKWYGNQDYIVNFKNKGTDFTRGKAQFSKFFFQSNISWSYISLSLVSRYFPRGFVWDVHGSSVFLEDSSLINYFMSLLNSRVGNYFLKIYNPTLSFQVENIAAVPVVLSENHNYINKKSIENIEIAKNYYDIHETSWNFTKNALIHHKSNGKIETSYSTFCSYWHESFNTLHRNEEELNSLFINIYNLQEELNSNIELKDITLLKQESIIIDNELTLNADEIIKQFISYGVGVMFGRYSLDQEGLVIANMGQEIPNNNTFTIDDDNIIPVLEDDYFTDDIASRFIEFVKVAFGEEHHTENIQFIEDVLGTTIRKYFVKGFYDDHIKRYKKRPIYWMISSPKKSFNALIYMHRYQDDIFARVQNNYLREYITKLEAAMHTATTIANDESNSATDRRKATKDIETITKKIDELIKFDRDKLTPFAQSRTPIDLDDGVKVNYSKFEEILYPIPGLSE
ncbi:MAG TPA: BREX-1 system adenine-specific DNA-methyltransferase PglX [Sulfuricurvum sp.]|nr:MAG: hypothetical protein B7Y30_07045 [Campylobacterales bacterium 16-40-21]OZA03560.1 MAG: hypothetical protein B7X89_02530 [Sulfuricurvum sp. 17-40-25]HQS65928.1 BREX-1 system adenine-specific DNA-methyltransferase PglX [Sulfuricurvum sp.]HQT35834.1 BREX-1 system adenine-specific DNA-methyltransferase PglX [Sulfuricurvum sp.]